MKPVKRSHGMLVGKSNCHMKLSLKNSSSPREMEGVWRYPATLMVAGVTVNAHYSLAITSNTCAIKGTTYWNILAHPFRSVTSH